MWCGEVRFGVMWWGVLGVWCTGVVVWCVGVVVYWGCVVVCWGCGVLGVWCGGGGGVVVWVGWGVVPNPMDNPPSCT